MGVALSGNNRRGGTLGEMRTHATVEVHHVFSGATNLRSFVTHSKTGFWWKMKVVPDEQCRAYVYIEKYCNTRLKIQTILG